MTKLWPFVLFLLVLGCTAAQKAVMGKVANGLDGAAPLASAANPFIGIAMNIAAGILRIVAANLPLKEEPANGKP